MPDGVSFHRNVPGFFQKKTRNRGLVHARISQKAALSSSVRGVEMAAPHSRPVAEFPVHESPPAHGAHSFYSWHQNGLPPTPEATIFSLLGPRCFVGQVKQKVPCPRTSGMSSSCNSFTSRRT